VACEASRSREPHTSLRSSATEPSGSRDLMCQRGSNRRSGKLRAEKTQSAFAEGGELLVPGSRRAEDIHSSKLWALNLAKTFKFRKPWTALEISYGNELRLTRPNRNT
jgi:hypothetical protein